MLILASSSPYRRAQLEQLGLTFEAMAPGVDEEAAKAESLPPADLALTLAEAKAKAVQARHPEAVVLGGDQVVAFDDQVLSKPGSANGAEAQLLRLAGRKHTLFTAVAIAHPEGVLHHLDRTELSMRSLTRAAVVRYVALDEPFDCVGAYKFERGGVALFDGVDTQDPSAITGLPLLAVVRMLTSLGFELP